MKAELRRRTISGLRWIMLNAVGEKGLSFLTTMVLARILDPHHFGVYSLAFIAIDSLGVFKNLGLDAAIIQRTERIEEAADTALLVLPLVGGSLCGLLYLAAPTVAGWLGQPEVAGPMRALGLVFILMSLGNVPAALIQKYMRFRLRTAANLSGMAVYTLVAITLALRGAGVYSLIVAYLARWTVNIVVLWANVRWVPSWKFDKSLFKEMLRFSKYVMGAGIISVLAASMDRLVIGRWLGMTSLGFYTLCLGLSNLVPVQVGTRAYQIVLPAFAQMQSDPKLAKAGFLKLMQYLLLCALPAAVLLFAVPVDLLHAFFGPRWTGAAPALQILALYSVFETVRAGIDPALTGFGRIRAVFCLNLLQLALLGTGGVWMARSGSLQGVIWAVTVASCVPGLVSLTVMMRTLRISLPELLAELRAPFFSACVMIAVVGVAGLIRVPLMGSRQPSGLWLLGMAVISLLSYAAAVFWFNRPIIADLIHLSGIRTAPAAGKS